jgi:hypothetical protein
MSYHLHHTIQFYNCLNEIIRIELYKKDVEPASVTELRAISFTVQYPTGSGGLFDTPIVSCEAKLVLYLETTDDQEFDDFIVTFPDEWKIIAYNDDQLIFVGFLTPGEGRAGLQDKPYEVTLSAVDGLGLLKGVPLTKTDNTNFTGVNLIIDYILAILNKTGLGLNLRLFSNIVEESMQDRTQNTQADTFNQTGLHARTFLKSPTTFYDCYTCLERMLSEYFTVYQHHGKWVILRIGELQTNPGNKIWYTEYNSAGTIVGAAQYLENAAGVGRDRLLHPVEISQFISSNFAIKSSRYTYNYGVWPELPTNNKFERGTEFESGSIDADHTYKKFTIDGWTFGKFIANPTQQTQLPALDSAAPDVAYRYATYNIFNVEENREILLENGSASQHRLLVSSEMPASVGDRFVVSYDFKYSVSGTGNLNHITIFVKPDDGGQLWTLENNGDTVFFWQIAGGWNYISHNYVTGENWNQYTSFSINVPPLPVKGRFFIGLLNFDSTNTISYYKNISIEYLPYINGSLQQVKADFAQTSQDDNFKDTIDEEVFISDSPKKVFQGALYRENLTDLTTPTWHRYGVNEGKHFKELGELARFNNNYRRMFKIEGQYDGLKFTPSDNQTFIEPLSFHRHFVFPDSSKLNGRYFVLVPPLTLNYSEGRADMNFVEVLQEGSQDGNSTGDSHIPLQYIFE